MELTEALENETLIKSAVHGVVSILLLLHNTDIQTRCIVTELLKKEPSRLLSLDNLAAIALAPMFWQTSYGHPRLLSQD